MRLLLICHEFPPIGGGGGRAAHALARLLGEAHEVTVITARGAEPALHDGRYRVIEVGPRRKAVFGASALEMIAFAVAAARAASRVRADACVAVQSVPAGLVAWWLGVRRGVPYVLRLVGADVPGFMPEGYRHIEWLMRRVSAFTWPRAAALVANSHGLRDLAQRTARGLGVTVEVIPNGVDTGFFRPAPRGAGSGPLKLVFVGRLVAQKGLHDLVAALRLERARLDGMVHIEIIGDGGEAASLAHALAVDGLDGFVTLTAWLARDAIVRRLQAADVFVLPSVDEGMPAALLEAMACGLPAIATAVSGTVELVEDGVNGLLVPPRDPAALGKALVDAATLGRERLAEMGRASRERAERFSWHDAAARYLRALESGTAKRDS